MQPVVHATTRTPGPSTVEPVVNEWRNPMSPEASASFTVCSGTSSPRSTRSSNGLAAPSDACGTEPSLVLDIASRSTVEGAADHVHLLLARQADEVHRVAGDSNGQRRVLLRMLHGI